MKFNCGKSWSAKRLRLSRWHRRFAWVSTRVGEHDCRWLEWIERKGIWHDGIGSGWWRWEYRA